MKSVFALILLACLAPIIVGQGRQRGSMADDEARQLLKLATRAQMSLRYVGMRITTVRVQEESIRNEELIWRDGRRQRTEFAKNSTNAGEVIVTDGRTRWHYFPTANEIHVKPAVMEQPLMRLLEGGPRRGFRLSVSAGGKLVGAETKRVDLLDPRGNKAASVWIDPKNGMALKRENFDPTGRLVGSFEYKRVNYSADISPKDFVIQRRGATVITVDALLRKEAAEAGLPPISLSPRSGYALDTVRVVDASGQKILVQSYTSEHGRVSVFVSTQPMNPQRLRTSARGRLNIYAQEFGAYRVVLMGEASEAQLKSLAAWLSREPAGNAS